MKPRFSPTAKTKEYYFGTALSSQRKETSHIIEPRPESTQLLLSIPERTNAGEISLTLDQPDSHLTIVVHEEARAVLTLQYQPSEADSAHCAIEIILEDGASLDCVFLQLSHAEQVTIEQRSQLANNAQLHWRNASLGGHQVEHSLESRLVGTAARSDIDWMFYAKDTERYSLSAKNIFEGRDGAGEITMKGVAEQKAQVDCDGAITIEKTGAGTDTYLTESMLMLDPTAKINAVPGLTIKTNDVKASHSATVSRVHPEDLFYFSARGIEEYEARKMFVLGFLGYDFSQNTLMMDSLLTKYAGVAP